jgi:hypothetical protein
MLLVLLVSFKCISDFNIIFIHFRFFPSNMQHVNFRLQRRKNRSIIKRKFCLIEWFFNLYFWLLIIKRWHIRRKQPKNVLNIMKQKFNIPFRNDHVISKFLLVLTWYFIFLNYVVRSDFIKETNKFPTKFNQIKAYIKSSLDATLLWEKLFSLVFQTSFRHDLTDDVDLIMSIPWTYST